MQVTRPYTKPPAEKRAVQMFADLEKKQLQGNTHDRQQASHVIMLVYSIHTERNVALLKRCKNDAAFFLQAMFMSRSRSFSPLPLVSLSIRLSLSLSLSRASVLFNWHTSVKSASVARKSASAVRTLEYFIVVICECSIEYVRPTFDMRRCSQLEIHVPLQSEERACCCS